MAFDPKKVRLERFRIELNFHAAYDFWSLKGALAEKWAHGPIFGAFVDQGNQVKLTPEGGFEKDRVEATYGTKVAAFDFEWVQDPAATYRLALQWLSDVVKVLGPRKTTRMAVQWFPLYPLGSFQTAQTANSKLRHGYYDDKGRFGTLLPDYPRKLAAVESMCLEGDKQWSCVMGLVGPPHKNMYFGVPDEERDSRWWMGLNFNLVRFDDENGLAVDESPMPLVEELLEEGESEYRRLVEQGLAGVV